MKRSKKGNVMLIVMVFMVISQIVYMGVIRLNQSQKYRLANFRSYYQAQIQTNLTLKELNLQLADRVGEVEAVIGKEMANMAEKERSQTVDDWWVKEDCYGIGHTVTNGRERVVIYLLTLYLDQTASKFVQDFETIEVDGFIQEPENKEDKPIYQGNEVESTHKSQVARWVKEVEEAGYQQVNQLEWHKPHTYQAKEGLQGSQNYNTGNLTYWVEDQALILESVIDGHDFIKRIALPQVPYRLHWQTVVYEKDVDQDHLDEGDEEEGEERGEIDEEEDSELE